MQRPNWYKNKYGITTVWSLVYNGDSITLRTEGSLSNSGRSNGIQGDAGRNATGRFYFGYERNVFASGTGIYTVEGIGKKNYTQKDAGANGYNNVYSDLSRAYTTANEFRMRNRLMRIYILKSIDGVQV